MANITAPSKLSDFSGFLTPEQSAPIFDQARKVSVAQQLARQVPLGASGVAVPVTTGRLSASWVAEGAQKPTSQGSMSLVTIMPKKIAVIAVVSQEMVRANPGNYVTSLQDQMAESFAVAFDSAVFHGASSPFSTNLDQTSKAVGLGTTNAAGGGVFTDLNSGLALLVNAGKKLTGFAFDTVAEPILNGSVDTTGRPLFIETPLTDVAPSVRGGNVLGRPARLSDGVAAPKPGTGGAAYPVAYGGDWTQCVWGTVGGINYAVSDETAVTINGTLVSLWENNLVAIRAEAEYGWLCNDTAAFVKFTRTS